MGPSHIVDYWKSVLKKSGPYLHDEDRHLDSSLIDDSRPDRLLSAGFLPYRDPQRYCVGLLPEPYVGDISNARVYILLLNPSLDAADLRAYTDPDYLDRTVLNLKQEFVSGKRRFYPLEDDFSWTGAGLWWRPRFRPIVEQLAPAGSTRPVSEVLDLIGERVAALEYWPYHSVSNLISEPRLRKCRSHIEMEAFVRDYVLKRAAKDDCCVIVPRSVRKWDLPRSHKNVWTRSPGEGRAVSLKWAKDEIIRFLEN